MVHHVKGRSVILEDCCGWANGNPKRLAAVYCEQMPDTLVVRDCYLGMPPVMVKPGLDLKKAFANKPDGLIHYDLEQNQCPYLGHPETKRVLTAIARRDKRLAPPEGGVLTPAQTKKALAKAVAEVQAMPSEKQDGPHENKFHQEHFKIAPHVQRTNAADYVEFRYDPKTWDLSEFMDNQPHRNHELLALAQAGDDIVVLRRAAACWPHVAIRKLEIDLDRTPWFTWKMKMPGKLKPSSTVMKILHDDTGIFRTLGANEYPQFFYLYNATDLRKLFPGLKGKQTFTALFYLNGETYGEVPGYVWALPKGEHMIIDFIRAEKD